MERAGKMSRLTDLLVSVCPSCAAETSFGAAHICPHTALITAYNDLVSAPVPVTAVEYARSILRRYELLTAMMELRDADGKPAGVPGAQQRRERLTVAVALARMVADSCKD
jgi:ABC-type arginine transport system ATPase subunit